MATKDVIDIIKNRYQVMGSINETPFTNLYKVKDLIDKNMY